MASCPDIISKENSYFLRSFLLLIEGGLYISKLILVRECHNSKSDLDELLERNESKLKHLFHGKQYKKLFPDFGSADINSWDLQLTIGVLMNVFGRSIGSKEKQNLRLLRDLRNDIYMHCSSASLDEIKFEDVKKELDEIITTLASTFDETVKGECSKYIDKFITGQLDAVRPALKTLNGFSQSCQKHFKVGVKTELTLGGPSKHWISLCEETLVRIVNHAESMASEDGGFQEVQENVKKMLDYLEDNKDVVLKGSKRKCIMLCFECKDYERFLHFLEDVESEKYKSILRSLSNSIVKFFKPKCSISISSKVTTESLQSALIAILKTVSNQEEEQLQTIVMSSEDTGNDMRGTTTPDTRNESNINIESQKPLVVDLESSSGDGLIHLLQTFQDRQFSDSLKKVASSLSNYHGTNVTLKASINVGDVFEDFEESVSRDVKIGTTAKNVDEPTIMPSATDEEKIFTIGRSCLIKSVNYLRRHLYNRSIWYLIETLPFTDTDNEYIKQGLTSENCTDRFFAKIVTGSKDLQKSFLENKYSDSMILHMIKMVKLQPVSVKDIKDLSALEASMIGKCQRPNGVKPLIKFSCLERCLLLKSKINPDGISAYLLSKIIISPQEFSEIIEKDGIGTKTAALLTNLEKCSQKHLEEFCKALKQHGSADIAYAIMKDKRVEPTSDEWISSLSRDVKIGTTAKNVDEPTIMPSATDEEKIFTIGRSCLIKSVNYLRKHLYNRSIWYLIETLPFTDTDNEYIKQGLTSENCTDRFFAKIVTGSKDLQKSFLENKYSDSMILHMIKMVKLQPVSVKDIKDLSALEASMTGKCQRPNGVKPLIKFSCLERCLLLKSKINPDGISAYLLSKIIISPQEFSEIIEKDGIGTKTAALLTNLEKCSQKHLEEFCKALKQHGSADIAYAIMKDKRVEPTSDEWISSRDSDLDAQYLRRDILQQNEKLENNTGSGFKFSQRSDDLDAVGKIKSEKPLKATIEYEEDTIITGNFEIDEKPRFYSKSEEEILKKVNEDDMQHGQVMYHKEMETETSEEEDDTDEIKRKLKSRHKLYESLSSFQ